MNYASYWCSMRQCQGGTCLYISVHVYLDVPICVLVLVDLIKKRWKKHIDFVITMLVLVHDCII